MSLWIQIDTQRSSNRKTYVLAELLSEGVGELFPGRDEIAWRGIAIALLDEFWSYVAEHFPDGEVTKAHAGALRKPLLEWLTGTPWMRGDVRELLVKSGHVDRRENGRLFVHDWMEWTGGSVLKLAKDRKRKRLARNKAPRSRPRTDIRKERGHSSPGPALAVQGSAMPSSPMQGSPKAAAVPDLDYATRCCLAVNRVLSERLAGAYITLVANVERPTAKAWESAGIPIELAEEILAELTDRFPNGRGRQPQSLGYFTAALHEAHAKRQASGGAAVALSSADRAQATLEKMQREAEAGTR